MKLPDPDLPIEAQDEDVLHAMLVWGEARGESQTGKDAVAHVAMNRVRRKHTSLASVILKAWAFSCFNKNDPNREKLLAPLKWGKQGVWSDCWKAAAEARQGLSLDPTNGAVCYCTRALWMRPAVAGKKAQWYELPEIASGRTKKTAVIGNHVFADTAI